VCGECSTSLDIKECISKLHKDFISPQLKGPSPRGKLANASKDVVKQEPLNTVSENEN
jgi:hypothetical protein